MNDRSPRPRRAALGALLFFGLLALGACGDSSEHDHDEDLAVPGSSQTTPAATEVVRLDSAALAMSGIQLGTVDAVHSGSLSVTGTITYDANRVSHVGPKTEGRIVGLTAQLGARVGAGQGLAVLESADVGAMRAELRESVALVEIARENYERERRLEAQGISSRKELLSAQAELRRAEAALSIARARLRILGAGQGEGGRFAVTAPFDGTIVEMHASRGEVAGPSDHLFTIADLSRLWIELDVFERDLAQVREGQTVAVTAAAYPDRVFPGRIVYVGDILNPETRTVRARVELPNEGGALKPGMFARALIEIGTAGTEQPAIPRAAVQELEGRRVVWVPGAVPGEFIARAVEVGPAVDSARVAILSGLKPGERVVVAGAFTLKAELSRGEFGGHSH